uniref:Prostaglandin reductase 1 n=1 Tax=Branchiostoma floridae TaxID=7739 RepID=C3YVG4_BRAFL|eukprot:XP_002599675.1 hypothetical protein BRAFLDRAFT_70354 [Branchiostoma floridae]
MVKSKRFVFARQFDGMPKESDFQLVEEETPALKDGEILVESLFNSVDPYMRATNGYNHDRRRMRSCHIGAPCAVRYHHYYVCFLGWWWVSMTAYFGFLKLCEPKEGETVFVNGAAGAVGSLVGQIAKIKGCRAVGSAGSDAKVAWLKELGFDAAFNYKTVSSLDAALKEAAPYGIDCYFDNVGADFTSTVLNHMNLYGRVSICGSISTYNDNEMAKGPYPFVTILSKQLTVAGFKVPRWFKEWPKGMEQMAQWIKEGKIKYKEHVTEGFENMPKAFIGMLVGENTGKAVVKL